LIQIPSSPPDGRVIVPTESPIEMVFAIHYDDSDRGTIELRVVELSDDGSIA
jgi:hypothetical protein